MPVPFSPGDTVGLWDGDSTSFFSRLTCSFTLLISIFHYHRPDDFYCFRLIVTTKRSVSLSANLTEGLRLPEKKIRKQLTPNVWSKDIPILSLQREERLHFSIFSRELSKFSVWKKLTASYVMSATDYPPRCKDKHLFWNDVQCELKFLQK